MKNPAKDKMIKNLTSKDCKRIVAVNMELLSEMEAVQETLANLMNPGVDMMDEASPLKTLAETDIDLADMAVAVKSSPLPAQVR